MSRLITKICDVCHERIDNTDDPSITIRNGKQSSLLRDFHTTCFEEMKPRDVAKAFLDIDDHLDIFEHRG